MNSGHTTTLFDQKVRRKLFRPVARHLPEHVAEDRLQEAICLTYEMFARYAARGTILPDAVLVHSCRQRATDAGRRFVATDSQPLKDVLDPRHQLARRFEVLSLDGLLTDEGEQPASDGDREVAFRAAMQHDPTREILSAIDLLEWFGRQTGRDQQMLALRFAGFTLGEIADEVRLAPPVVCARLHALGTDLAVHAGLPTGKRARKKRAPRAAS